MNVCPQRRGRSPHVRYHLKTAHPSCHPPLTASAQRTWPGSPVWPVGMRVAWAAIVAPVSLMGPSTNPSSPHQTLHPPPPPH